MTDDPEYPVRFVRASRLVDGRRWETFDELATDGGRELENDGRPPFIKPDVDRVRCHFCDRSWDAEVVDGFDLSSDDEYYPNMVPVCPEALGGCP